MRGKGRVSRTISLAAPTGGIDDTNSLAGMDPHYAIEMLNYFPQNSSLRVRPGYGEWTTGLPANAKTLIPFTTALGQNILWACTDVGMYDCSVKGAAPGVASRALTNGFVDWTMFGNTATQFLVVVNGTTDNFMYDGTAFYPIVFNAAPAGPGQISGMTTPQDFIQVTAHKRRLWFVEKNSTSAWYLPTDAVAGAATEFLLGSIFKRGGYLRNIFTWTRGAGDGIDDILIFQSSNGELAGYSGTDPSSASTWNLEAVFWVGSPLADRTNCDLGSDVALVNVYGVMAMSSIVSGVVGPESTQNTLSKRITRTLNELAQNSGFDPKWEIASFPSHQYLMLVVPGTANRDPIQFVMNMVNGAWTTYDLPILTTAQRSERLYFSDTTGKIYLLGNVYQDGVLLDGSGGTPIVAGFMQAYSDFGDGSVDKHYKLVRPIFTSSVQPSYTLRANADYAPDRLNSLQTPGPVSNQLINTWDSAVWDSATWSEGVVSFYEWVGVTGIGYAAALILKTRTVADTEFISCNWAFEPGVSL